VTPPHGWAWLERLTIVAVLLVVEIVADKILRWTASTTPSDVRPADGRRHVFGSARRADVRVTDPGAFVPRVSGFPSPSEGDRAKVSLTKSTVRPAANVATAGMAAPVLSPSR
jgi:hypothetical protein